MVRGNATFQRIDRVEFQGNAGGNVHDVQTAAMKDLCRQRFSYLRFKSAWQSRNVRGRHSSKGYRDTNVLGHGFTIGNRRLGRTNHEPTARTDGIHYNTAMSVRCKDTIVAMGCRC
jgi:hypothetical protein